MRVSCASRKNRGFTLIEVLVTLFLLGVVLITLISVFIYGFTIIFRTRQTVLATQIAQEEIELIRNKTFDEILTLGTAFEHESLALLESGQGLLAIADGPGDEIKKLSVSVTWRFRGEEMRKDVVTYITREGINKK